MAQLIFINSNPHLNLFARVSASAMVCVCVCVCAAKMLEWKIVIIALYVFVCVLAVTAGAQVDVMCGLCNMQTQRKRDILSLLLHHSFRRAQW